MAEIISGPLLSAGKPMKKGDVLFQIDPTPYRLEVERLQGALDEANTTVAQLQEQVQAATAARKNSESQLEASESELDQQTREKIEQARGARLQVATTVDFAKVELDRATEQLKSGIISQQQLDLTKAKYDAAVAQLQQADAALRQAEQSLGSGSSRIQSARETVQQAEAREREVKLELESQSAGLNPEVRQILAQLQSAQFDLDSTTVRAPTDGTPVQVFLRPGQMATALGALPTMIFMQGDRSELIASFPQNTIKYFKPGLEAELAIKMYPGQIFKAKVKSIATIMPEGQLQPSGTVRTTAPAKNTYVPVIFEYGPEVEALKLPPGAQIGVAVYTEHLHALSILRKIILRMKSWENYLFSISLGH